MSGHPSFIPKAGGGPRRGPGGHGHGPGGHGPAARMMGGETALAFGPTMKRMLAFMGQFKGRLLLVFLFAIASTAFSIVGPKVLSEATTVLFDGAVASAAGTGSIDFDAIGRILLADAGPVPAVGGVLVGAVLGHELRLPADLLPFARRHRAQDRPRALRLLREDLHGRHPLAHHQRRGHPGPEPQSRHHPGHHLGGHGGGRACHDALHQLDHDARGPGAWCRSPWRSWRWW